MRLGPNDLDGALAVVAEAASTQSAQPFELPVIERLLGLIPGDRAGYFEHRQPKGDIYKVENRALGHRVGHRSDPGCRQVVAAAPLGWKRITPSSSATC